jgi:hypothetical protein
LVVVDHQMRQLKIEMLLVSPAAGHILQALAGVVVAVATDVFTKGLLWQAKF